MTILDVISYPVRVVGYSCFCRLALTTGGAIPNFDVIAKLCATWSLVIMCSSIKAITLPLLLDSFLSAPEASRWQGYFGTITGLSGFVFCSLLGFLSDVHGRQRVLIPWILVFVAAGVIDTACWFYRSVYLLASARLCAVVIGSTLVAAISSDHYSGRQLLRVQGLIGASFGASLILGAVLVVVISKLFTQDNALLVNFCVVNVLSVFALHFARNLTLPAANRRSVHHLKEDADQATDGAASISVGAPVGGHPPNTTEGITGGSPSSTLVAGQAPISSVVVGSGKPPLQQASIVQPSSAAPSRGICWDVKRAAVRGVQVLRRVSADGFLHGLVWAYALLKLVNICTMIIFVLYVKYRYRWRMDTVGTSMAVYGIFGIFYQTLGIRMLNKMHIPTHKALIVVAMFFPLLTVSFGLASTGRQMFAAIALGSISGMFGSLFSSKLTMLASQQHIAGLAMGLVGSIQNLLEIPAGAAMGHLLAHAVENYDPSSIQAGYPYYLLGTLAVVPVAMLVVLDRKYATREGWRTEKIAGSMTADEAVADIDGGGKSSDEDAIEVIWVGSDVKDPRHQT